MKYSQAGVGRCFVLRLEHDEIVHDEIERFAGEHDIRSASITIIGATGEKSTLVVGVEQADDRPVVLMLRNLVGVNEVVGNGILLPDDKGNPHIHIHLACGREENTTIGCIRKGVRVWQTMEVFIQELLDTPASRPLDSTLGFNLLDPEGANPDHAHRTGIRIHPTAKVHPSVIIDGDATVGAHASIGAGTALSGSVNIGHHSLIACNVTIRGGDVEIGNYTHIYDNACIEGGRPANYGSCTGLQPDKTTIGDHCWVNHGAVMHGTQMADCSTVGLNSCCDYDTRIGKGAVLANGSATKVGQRIPADCIAEGVPAVVVKENITDEDRSALLGLNPSSWIAQYANDVDKS